MESSKKPVKVLTKVAKGIAFGDVSNAAVRNILTEVSKQVFGGITEQEMQDTLDFFEWKCPYTGRDLRDEIENKRGGYATDHIYPQNAKCCGLNVKGNLIIVDKKANGEKQGKSVEEFFNNPNSKVLQGVDFKTREDRLNKIKEFQKMCGYDAFSIKQQLAPLLSMRYNNVRKEQECCIDDAIEILKTLGIALVTPIKEFKTVKKNKSVPDILFYIAGIQVVEDKFKKELLEKKKATFILTYESGVVKQSPWKAEQFDILSGLRSNIQSRPFWRNKDQEGLVKVEVTID